VPAYEDINVGINQLRDQFRNMTAGMIEDQDIGIGGTVCVM